MGEALWTGDIEAVSDRLLEAGVYVGETKARREKAVWFLEQGWTLEDLELLVEFEAERRGKAHTPGGLLLYYLDDGTRVKEALHYKRVQKGKPAGGNLRFGQAPAYDLPGSDEARARAAGFAGDVEAWEVDRAKRMMWTRWCDELRNLPYEERLERVARESGQSVEDAYEILSQKAVESCRYALGMNQARLAAAKGDQKNRLLKRDPGCLEKLEELVAGYEAMCAQVTNLTQWEDYERRRKALLFKKARKKRVV